MEKEKKKVVIDHYRVLGLPSGKEGTKLNEKEITKAYRAKALQLHPDKRPNDPDANAKFQRLNSSYAILSDPKSRKQFDSSLIRLDNKPSPEPKKNPSSEPKKKTSEQNKKDHEPKKKTSEPNEKDHKDELFLWGFFIFVIAPMIFPAGRAHVGFMSRAFCLLCGIEELRNDENLWSMVVRVGNYFKRNPPHTATNQDSESQGDDHEDIEDWVIV